MSKPTWKRRKMPFPAIPENKDARGLFVVQDHRLRSKILPLFSFHPQRTEERPIGHGSAFRIDPWGTCATAFHVIEDLLIIKNAKFLLRPDFRLSALEIERVGYGRFALPKGSWRPITALSAAVAGIESPPMAEPRLRNTTELASLTILRGSEAGSNVPFLPVDFRKWRPKVGDRVMAMGFADLDVDAHNEGDLRTMTQHLYGSEAEIIQVEKADGTSSRPWPRFRVTADWPGGMSGGPVFNEAGNVVGLVSTGVSGQVGTATYFSGWDFAGRTFPSLDANNSGWLKCWIAFDLNQKIVSVAPPKEHLEPLIAEGKAKYLRLSAFNPATHDFMSI